MIRPVSNVSFRAELPKIDAMDAISKTQKTMATINNLSQGADEFKKNVETDKAAYSDGITDSIKEAAKDNKALEPLAKAAESKTGKKIVKAGSLLDKTGKIANDKTVRYVLLKDIDVTYGNAAGAGVYRGTLDKKKIEKNTLSMLDFMLNVGLQRFCRR